MAQSDRQRLLDRALALPQAAPGDFFGDRHPPDGAKAELLKRIDDTSLRTKLVEVRLAEGLQSPKGPQKIASIVRIYPDFDAPPRVSTNGRRTRPRPATAAAAAPARGLPSVAEMRALVDRIDAVERDVENELGSATDERIVRLKRALLDLDGDELEAAYRELGEALENKRALASQIRFETFNRIEGDTSFAPRTFLRFLRR